MYIHFFGNYLLTSGLITMDELFIALNKKSDSTLKIGIMAIDAGYMTASEVEKVHNTQATVDKMFGELAVDLGYINTEQLYSLISHQKNSALQLGQALVDSDILSMADLEEALKLFKEKYSVKDSDSFSGNFQLNSIIERFIDGSENRTSYHLRYIILLIKNLVRFVGDDFILIKDNEVKEKINPLKVTQNILGNPKFSTHMCGEKETLKTFVTRFINEDLNDNDEYLEAGICDFMNLHNGLFAVNMSMEDNIELTLSVPEVSDIPIDNDDPSLVIKILYPFGGIAFDIMI